jgi:hypothetical protein
MGLNITKGGKRPKPEPVRGRELQRILALPKRDKPPRHIVKKVRELERKGKFFPRQFDALCEAAQVEGLFASLGVGEGKTLISFAIPSLFRKSRCLLLVPAKLKDKTKKEWHFYADLFRLRSDIRIESYARVSSIDTPTFLYDFAPDIIIADEAHKLARPESARTRRFLKYMRERIKKGRPVKFFAMSASVTRKSIKEYAHLIELALGDMSPLPRPIAGFYTTVEEWADVLDVNAPLADRPGALRDLCTTHKQTVPDGFRNRVVTTPGVVYSEETSLDSSLVIEVLDVEPSKRVRDALEQLERTWTRRDGWEVDSAIELSRIRRQYLLGGYYKLLFPKEFPVSDWLHTRSEWASDCRSLIKAQSRNNIDTPGLVERAIKRGDIVCPSYHRWMEMLSAHPMPPRRWTYFSKQQLRTTSDCLRGFQSPVLAWASLKAPSVRFAKDNLLPYFGQGAKPKRLLRALSEAEEADNLVLSYSVYGEGFNLQPWHNNFILEAPSSGAAWEQLLGRTHRRGQKADEVRVVIPGWWTPELRKALRDARYIEETTGNKQRLLMADILWGSEWK